MSKSLSHADNVSCSDPGPDGPGCAGGPDPLFSDQLQRMARSRRRHMQAAAAAHGLVDTDVAAVDHLIDAGPLTAAELGRRVGLTSGALTRLADRLAAEGLAERVPNPEDRRSVLLAVTAKGKHMSHATIGAFEDEVQELFAALPPGERAAVHGFFARLLEVSERHAAGPCGPAH